MEYIMSDTITALNDLRQRVLAHEAAVAAGEANANEPPYTIDELKEAIASISKNRSALAETKPKKSASNKIDLDDLL